VSRTLDPRDDPDVLLEDAPRSLAYMRHERDSWARHDDESERYYTALGVLLEDKVRGLIREWRAAP